MVIRQALNMMKAKNEGVILLAHLLKKDKSYILVNRELELGEQISLKYIELVGMRRKGCPVAYLTGVKEFYSLDFFVSPHCLIPRPETERLVDAVMEYIMLNESNIKTVADICTGSGCIGIAVAKAFKTLKVEAFDISYEALRLAEENAENHNVEINFAPIDILNQKLEQPFDIIVSNPPYVKRCEIECLMSEVAEYEPALALDGGEDGLDFYRAILKNTNSQAIFFEVGHDQAEAVQQLMDQNYHVKTVLDYSNIPRVVWGTRK